MQEESQTTQPQTTEVSSDAPPVPQSSGNDTPLDASPAPQQPPKRKLPVYFIPAIVVIFLLISAAIGYFLPLESIFPSLSNLSNTDQVNSYLDCINAPESKIVQPYPGVCITKDGQRFAEETPTEQKPTPLPTTPVRSWNIYIEPNSRLSFKYPSNLRPSECKSGIHFFEIHTDFKSSEFCESPPFGVISVYFSKYSLDVGYKASSDFEVTQEQITIAGFQATKQTVKKLTQAPGPDFSIFVTFTDNNYHFMFILRETRHEEVFEELLPSIKILEPVD